MIENAPSVTLKVMLLIDMGYKTYKHRYLKSGIHVYIEVFIDNLLHLHAKA